MQSEKRSIVLTRKRFRRAHELFEVAARDREQFRRTCVEFFEIERRKPVRLQEWVLWAVLRDVAFESGLVHIWQGAYDHVDMQLQEGTDEDFRLCPPDYSTRKADLKRKVRGACRDTQSRRPEELIREYERLALIKARHAAIKARRGKIPPPNA